ncbi:thiol peroxidase [Constantimarinum furrinae]|uniref:Thiol peroxidase n=1 Tax=Constantimarinum furrinae TaxID=2562285 RepID=A0A7G8PXI3_9FLAO|nr:thiol peroxidase [Constantimarinum furrinae]QNJ99049.1 thiol peroxidase [Constantimarinum furrinae]
MAKITLGGNPVETLGSLPDVGSKAPEFTLITTDLSSKSLSEYKGVKVLLNIFPSIDTGICATSTRKFNVEAAGLENTRVLCISRDTPFAQKRFCAAEGIEHVEMLSDFNKGSFGKDYNLEMIDGAMQGFHSRAIVVLDEFGTVLYKEQVPEIGKEPDYKAALNAIT